MKGKHKVYLVERDERIGWNEYDSCVVVAKDKEEAFTVAYENYNRDFKRDKVKITEIKLNKARPILGSFIQGY